MPIMDTPWIKQKTRLSHVLKPFYRLGRGAVIGMVAGGVILAFSLGRVAYAEPPESQPDSATSITDFTEEEQSHWAFQQIVRPALPRVREQNRVRTPIDAFLLSRLEEKGLTYSLPARKRELLRRAKYDLLGLPPTPEEIEQFLADDSPAAYERLIDRFLAGPQYGETWGRNWLDLVRFAETAGFNADPDRPLAYKYRDYVIRAFNDNTPYDRFIQEQIAGDELFPENLDALIATGYNRMWPDESNASNVLLARQDALNDLTANVGAVYLGLSVGCAQCHDHKFDPIPQTDFYQLQAFFVGIVPEDRVPVGTHKQLLEYRKNLEHWHKQTAPVRDELHKIESDAKAKAAYIKRLKFPEVVLKAIDTAPEYRDAFQWQLVFWSERQIELKEKDILGKMSKEQQARREELKKQRVELLKAKPELPGRADVMATVELPTGPPKTHLLAGGSYTKPLQELQPGYISVFKPGKSNLAQLSPPRPGTSGRRAALAKWMTSADNPLVPRVIVNRIWQGHFAKGLVSNANDFGTQTAPPSHPELLDWLASEFVASGWNIKQMHRLMMTSEAYRQSTYRQLEHQTVPQAVEKDADNVLYWHYARRRLTAERIRDSLLAVSGKLSTRMYGYGIKPELPPNFSARHAWKPSKTASERNRRSVYIYAKRNLPYPLLKAFDLPDMHESCARRAETTIAPQALTLLNSELIFGAAKLLAARLQSETSINDLPTLVKQAYVTTFNRQPEQDELNSSLEFIKQQAELVAENQKKDAGTAQQIAFIDFCHALLNANEFLYLE